MTIEGGTHTYDVMVSEFLLKKFLSYFETITLTGKLQVQFKDLFF